LRSASSAGLVLLLVAALALPGPAAAQQANGGTTVQINAQLKLPLPKKLCEELSKLIPIIDEYCEVLKGLLPKKPKVKARLHIHGGGGGGAIGGGGGAGGGGAVGVGGLQVASTVSTQTAGQLNALGEDGQGVLRLPGVRRAKTRHAAAAKPEIFNPMIGLTRASDKSSSSWWIAIAAAIIVGALSLLAVLRRRASGSGPPPAA
jgi:hypothetical protein